MTMMMNTRGKKLGALVIGGGIAGIQAALDIADAGFQVCLVERSPSIGGRMAQLDKTFPTLDCSSCILTPKMVDIGRHPNVNLLTYSEVVHVTPGDKSFRACIKKKPRYVDEDKCRGCGLCAQACRLNGRVPSEFNAGIAKRAAIYVPFPQAVPMVYTVDPQACVYLTRGVCGKTFKCKDACPENAIDFEMPEEFFELDVGAIVVATGYDVFDPLLKPEFGYGVYPEVITSLEFERLVSASGPTAGVIANDGRTPRKVVFIQCVGSRDRSLGLINCSRVCCMAVAKQAHLAHQRLADAKITVFYMDVRAFGKGFEEFYDRVRQEGVIYRRGNPSEIYRRGETVVVRAEDTLLGESIEAEADLVVLAVGMLPRHDAGDVAHSLGLSRSNDGYFMESHPNMRTVESKVPGVFLAGCCQGPKDIPDTVAHAKAAASAAMILLTKNGARSQLEAPSFVARV
jgi:heterodisulfide reductase subunit A